MWSQLAEHLNYVATAFTAIFVIVDPFAVVPVYLALTERHDRHQRRVIRRKATLLASLILSAFAIAGMKIFNLFGITLPAFQIAGGLLLLILGVEQLGANRDRVKDEERDESMHRDEIAVFPLATPLLAGPGSISTVVLFSAEAPTPLMGASLVVAVILAMAAAHLTLKSAPLLYRALGQTGLNLFTRLMGVLLTAIAVQFILNGIKTFAAGFGSH